MILGALVLGLLIGLALGALGGGGSILTVPALVFVLGLSAREATTGSLVIVGVTAAIASVGHARAGNTRWRQGFLLGAAGVPASLLGSALNRLVAPDALLLAFAALMLVAASGMLLRAGPGTPSAGEPPAAAGRSGVVTATATATATATRTRRASVELAAAGLGIGFLTGFLGVGGGFVIVPALVLLLRFSMPVAVGTSLFVISLNSVVALAARAGSGGFVWSVLVPFTLAAVVGSLAGQRVSGRVDSERLTRAFAVLLLVVAAYVAVRAILGTG